MERRYIRTFLKSLVNTHIPCCWVCVKLVALAFLYKNLARCTHAHRACHTLSEARAKPIGNKLINLCNRREKQDKMNRNQAREKGSTCTTVIQWTPVYMWVIFTFFSMERNSKYLAENPSVHGISNFSRAYLKYKENATWEAEIQTTMTWHPIGWLHDSAKTFSTFFNTY